MGLVVQLLDFLPKPFIPTHLMSHYHHHSALFVLVYICICNVLLYMFCLLYHTFQKGQVTVALR